MQKNWQTKLQFNAILEHSQKQNANSDIVSSQHMSTNQQMLQTLAGSFNTKAQRYESHIQNTIKSHKITAPNQIWQRYTKAPFAAALTN